TTVSHARAQRAGRLVGRVVDATTGAGISAAQVELLGMQSGALTARVDSARVLPWVLSGCNRCVTTLARLRINSQRLSTPMKPATRGETRQDRTTGNVSFPVRVGSIDIGSNALRFMASEFSAPRSFTVLEQTRCPVRLGHDVFLTGKLTAEAMTAAIEALTTFARRIEQLEIVRYRAVTTSAVRDSRNGDDFLERAQKESGIRVDVISGAEEARLVHLAVAHRIELGQRKWILADLGGGSVEVSLADADAVYWTQSHGMGSVRLLEELAVAGDEPGRFRRRLEEYTATLELHIRGNVRAAGFIATGGNIDALARLVQAEPDAAGVSRITLTKLRSAIQALAGLSYRQRVDELGLRDDRADVILPAAMVYERLASLAGFDEILAPNVGIKEGVLIDIVEELVPLRRRHRQDRIAWSGALTLGRRYRLDAAHGKQVARLALSLLEQLESAAEFDELDRRVLVAAAVLHDVGTFVAYRRHHKHSYYIISESELPGFSPAEIQLVANVARYHRKSFPAPHHEPYMKLSEKNRERVSRLAGILRIADALDREHRQTVQDVRAAVEGKSLVLEVNGTGDLLLERWALQQKAGLFEKMFGWDVRIREDTHG
ncbi:MAG: HD domain-containing protein, partial [Longimicrobiales bacterium]